MGRLSDDAQGSLLDVVFGGITNPWAGDTFYVGLSTTYPEDDGTGITEPSTGGYARSAVVNNLTNWPAATDRRKANGTVIAFPLITADLGDAVAAIVMSASTAGDMIAWGELILPVTLRAGKRPRIEVGDFVVLGPGA